MPRHTPKLRLTAALVASALLLGAGLAGCNRTQDAATLVAEAKSYEQKGDYRAALIQLKNAVAASPEDAAIRLQLATMHSELGDPVSAEKEYRKALSLGTPPAQVMPGLAASLLAQGEFKKLLADTEPHIAAGGAPLLVHRGHALLASGQPDDAKASFDAALAAKPDDSAALLGLASLAFSKNDVETGNRYAEEAAAKDPKNPEVWMLKAMLSARQGKSDAALVAYDQVLTLKPNHRSANIEKAYLEIGLGQFDKAKADLAAASKITPGSMIVVYTQALLDYTQGRNDIALEGVQKVLRAAPEHMPSILLAGAIQLNMGQLEQAEQNLKKYLEKNPDSLYARKLLASTQLRASHPADAAATLAPALKTQTEDAQLLALAGESHMQTREFGKATEYFQQAATLSPKTAALRTSLGMSKMGQGNQDQAVAELEMATTLDPKSQQAGVALTRAALALKQYDKALSAVQALEKQQPDNAMVQNLKGGVHMARNEAAAARAAFNRAVALQKDYYPAVVNLAGMDMSDNKPEEAKKRLEAFLQVDKKHVGAMTALAQLAASRGDAAGTRAWLEKASNDNPDMVEPGMRLAEFYLRTNEKSKALTLVRKLHAANPTNPDLLGELGQAQMANNDFNGALESYSKLVNLVPKSAKAQLRLAAAHLALKNDAAAQEDVKRAIALEPQNVQAKLAMVDLAVRRGNTDEAIRLAKGVQKDHPTLAIGFAVEADLLMSQKKPELALRAFQQAYALEKNSKNLLKTNQLLRLTGKTKEAEAELSQFLKENPNDAIATMFAAEMQLAAKQYKNAIGLLEGLVKRNPNAVPALNNLAWAYQQDKDARALPTAEQAYRLAGDNPAIMDTLGWILIEKGDLKRGLPILEKAVAAQPQANDFRYHLAMGLDKAGDKKRARAEMEKALANGGPFAQAAEARAYLKPM